MTPDIQQFEGHVLDILPTLAVAKSSGRNAVGIELGPSYNKLARRRLGSAPLPTVPLPIPEDKKENLIQLKLNADL